MNAFLVVVSAALLLASAWSGVASDLAARRYFPLQFTDEPSSRYYAAFTLFDRTLPLKARRLSAVSAALGMAAFAGFAAVAYRAGNPALAVLLLFACAMGIANVLCQWRRARR
jgi:hypothetical protein